MGCEPQQPDYLFVGRVRAHERNLSRRLRGVAQSAPRLMAFDREPSDSLRNSRTSVTGFGQPDRDRLLAFTTIVAMQATCFVSAHVGGRMYRCCSAGPFLPNPHSRANCLPIEGRGCVCEEAYRRLNGRLPSVSVKFSTARSKYCRRNSSLQVAATASLACRSVHVRTINARVLQTNRLIREP
jgi:hypothetical protein